MTKNILKYKCPDCGGWSSPQEILTEHAKCKLVKDILRQLDEGCVKEVGM